MKNRLFLLSILFFFQCSEVVYEHESEFDYSSYYTTTVYDLYSSEDFLSPSDEIHLMRRFRDKLLEKSGFKNVYIACLDGEFSSDCDIRIRVDYIDKEEEIEDDGDGKIEVEIKLNVLVVKNQSKDLIKSFSRGGNGDRDFSRYDSTDERVEKTYEATYDAMKDALDKIASEFLKDLSI